MHARLIPLVASLAVLPGATPVSGQAEVRKHHNPMIDLLEQKKPVFGLYAPSNRRFTPPGAPTPSPVPPKTPLDLAIVILLALTSARDGNVQPVLRRLSKDARSLRLREVAAECLREFSASP